MKNRHYNLVVNRFLCFLTALLFIYAGIGIGEMDKLKTKNKVHYSNGSVIKIKGFRHFSLNQEFSLQDCLGDKSDLIEQEQDSDFIRAVPFFPLFSIRSIILSERISFRPEFFSFHIQETASPPPQLYI